MTFVTSSDRDNCDITLEGFVDISYYTNPWMYLIAHFNLMLRRRNVSSYTETSTQRRRCTCSSSPYHASTRIMRVNMILHIVEGIPRPDRRLLHSISYYYTNYILTAAPEQD